MFYGQRICLNLENPSSSCLCSLRFRSQLLFYNHNSFLVQSRTMRIPRIYFVGPMSFIVNDLLRAFFKLPIFFGSSPTISMSSTYTRRMTKSPPSNFFTNTQWSAYVLWYPWSRTYGTIDRELASIHISSSSTGTPSSPSLS